MPIGASSAVPWIAKHLVSTRPARVLDLGVGFGMNGAIVRQWLDGGVRPWKTALFGVEGWSNYRNPLWELYDAMFVQRIEDFLTSGSNLFDCVILGDVIEHLEKDDGRHLVDQIKLRVSGNGHLIVVTPAEFFEQSAVYGNELEVHRSAWTASDLSSLGCNVIEVGSPSPESLDHALIGHWQRSE